MNNILKRIYKFIIKEGEFFMVDLLLFNNLVWIIILLLFLLFIKGAELAYLAKRFLLHVEELGFLALV